jgi:DNA-binding CsgD family transcriptional regulator
MRSLETNEWILINDIILKIHTTDDDTEMRRLFLNSLRLLVPFDMATFYLADEQSPLLLKNPVGLDCPIDAINKYSEVGEKLDYTRWMAMQHKNIVYKETDLYPDQVRESLPYYIEMYKPFNIHYTAHINLVYNEVFLGVASLYRSKDDVDFTDKETFALDILKDHLAYHLYIIAAAEKLIMKKPKDIIDPQSLKSVYKLTEREVELIGLLFQGYSNEDASKQLNISLHTVKKHLLNIYRKSGVTSRLQLFFLLTTLSESSAR